MGHPNEFKRLLRQKAAAETAPARRTAAANRLLPGETARALPTPVKLDAGSWRRRRGAIGRTWQRISGNEWRLVALGGVLAGLIAAAMPGLWPATEQASIAPVDPWAESKRSKVILEAQEGAPASLVDDRGRLLARATGPAITRAVRFGLCHSGGGADCVVDGDTFWMAGEKIRIADIDTPETHPPRCAEEARLGAAATARLHALLNAGPVTLESIDRDTDRYGRKLRVVTRGGKSLGGVLVDEGLARWYGGGRRSWCG